MAKPRVSRRSGDRLLGVVEVERRDRRLAEYPERITACHPDHRAGAESIDSHQFQTNDSIVRLRLPKWLRHPACAGTRGAVFFSEFLTSQRAPRALETRLPAADKESGRRVADARCDAWSIHTRIE